MLRGEGTHYKVCGGDWHRHKGEPVKELCATGFDSPHLHHMGQDGTMLREPAKLAYEGLTPSPDSTGVW